VVALSFLERSEEMARLEAMAKMGYYPTPEELTPTIAKYLKPKGPGRIRTLDPCAGEGTALKTIGDHLDAETYGIEIDHKRGAIAQQKLTRCLVTDYTATQITPQFASLLWLNPPYDWAARGKDLERSERYERTFLKGSIKYLVPGGVLVYLIPIGRLDGTIARMLAYRFEQIRIYKFPENLFSRFKQIVVFGVCKKTPSTEESIAESLKAIGTGKVSVPSLPESPELIYEVPCSPDLKNFLFRTFEVNPEELEEEIRVHGLDEELQEMINGRTREGRMVSVMPLRLGHLAQVIACGSLKGVVFDQNHRNPMIVKGITRKVVDTRIEREGNTEREIETDRIVITINAFNQAGELITIQ
jgi:hypothetical protein